jgi:hypothetical protein
VVLEHNPTVEQAVGDAQQTVAIRTVDDDLSFAKMAICLQNKQMKVHSTWLESM